MGCGFGFVFSLLIFLPVTGCAVFLKNRPQGALSLQPKPLDLGDHVEFYLFIYLLIYLFVPILPELLPGWAPGRGPYPSSL